MDHPGDRYHHAAKQGATQRSTAIARADKFTVANEGASVIAWGNRWPAKRLRQPRSSKGINNNQTIRNRRENMKILLATLCFTCALAVSLQAQEGKKKQAIIDEHKAAKKEIIAKYDTNKDGKLDKEEKAKMTKEDKALLRKLGVAHEKKDDLKKKEMKKGQKKGEIKKEEMKKEEMKKEEMKKEEKEPDTE